MWLQTRFLVFSHWKMSSAPNLIKCSSHGNKEQPKCALLDKRSHIAKCHIWKKSTLFEHIRYKILRRITHADQKNWYKEKWLHENKQKYKMEIPMVFLYLLPCLECFPKLCWHAKFPSEMWRNYWNWKCNRFPTHIFPSFIYLKVKKAISLFPNQCVSPFVSPIFWTTNTEIWPFNIG